MADVTVTGGTTDLTVISSDSENLELSVVVDSGAINVTLAAFQGVAGYDADTAKLDVAQSWTATQTFKGLGETVAALSGTTPSISVANGTILTWTLTANSSPTDGLSAGQSVLLEIDDGTAYTITWPSVTWKTNGGSPPTLKTTGITSIVLYKVGSVLYGARVGDA
jgi:hypothetical protein